MICMFDILRLVLVHYHNFMQTLAKTRKNGRRACIATYGQEKFQFSRAGFRTIPSLGAIWEEPAWNTSRFPFLPAQLFLNQKWARRTMTWKRRAQHARTRCQRVRHVIARWGNTDGQEIRRHIYLELHAVT